MKKLPKSISILGRNYRITEVSMEKMIEVSEERSMGCVCFTSKNIYLIEGMTNEDKLLTLAHETVHIALTVTGLNLIIPFKIQEVICETMANLYLDLIKGLSK